MAVRNLKDPRNKKPIPIHVYVPPKFNPVWKIEVETKSDTYDITDLLKDGEYTNGITENIGSFNLTIDNSGNRFTGVFKIYNKVKIYTDYGKEANTLRYVGLVEQIPKSFNKTQGNNITLKGRGAAVRVIGKNIIYRAKDKTRSEILKEIIDKYFPDKITTNNIEETTDKVDVNYFEKPFWEVVKELCKGAQYDAFIDVNFDFNFFEKGSRKNETEVVNHDYNLIETGNFADDIEEMANKVRVYGQTEEGLPIIASSQDEDSQGLVDGDIKELKINDTSITSSSQAKTRADYELLKNKDPISIGEITSLMLPTLEPGQILFITDPLNGLEPKYYAVQKYKHKFSNDNPPETTITIQKEKLSIPEIMKKRIDFETRTTENRNPYDLDNSLVWDFEEDEGSHENTKIDTDNNVLKLQDGYSEGVWTSDVYNIEKEGAGEFYLRVEGEKISNVISSISVDGGSTYTPTTIGDRQTISGSDVRVKLNINSPDVEIKEVVVYYK